MSLLLVLSPQAPEIRDALAGRLPQGLRAVYATDALDLPPGAQEADIAFGVPDLLAEALPSLPGLRWVQSTWAGVEPLLRAPRRDYLLTNARGIFGDAMSEYVLGWLLALRRGVLQRAVATSWQGAADPGIAAMRLGIAGVGAIGAEVAARCAPFVGAVIGLNSDGRSVPHCERCLPASRALEFAEGLDALVLLLPRTVATDALADRALLQRLRPGAIVISAGRANALDLPAALSLLEAEHLGALVLDVLPREPLPDHDPLWRRDRVFITSHTAAPTEVDAVVGLFLRNLQRYLDEQEPLARVDFERGY